MPNLNPLTCPLSGRQLIEASAGTGKTYTIGLLFLRLLLERRLEVNQILVVTFTDAATQELRDRIRKRIKEALDVLRYPGQPADASLRALLQDHIPHPDHPGPAEGPYSDSQSRLADALVRMDEAAIYSIHGFCARVLQDHAFETGLAFELELIGSDDALGRTLIRDFWRIQMARLPIENLGQLLGLWKTPDALFDAMARLFQQQQLEILPRCDLAEFQSRRAELERMHKALGQEWTRCKADVTEILQKSPALNRKSYTSNVVAKALAAMEDFIGLTSLVHIPDMKYLERFTPAMLKEQTKEAKATPQHPFFDATAELLGHIEAVFGLLKPAWLREAHIWLKERLNAYKSSHRQAAFNDLINRVAEALTQGNGPQGHLAEQLDKQLTRQLAQQLAKQLAQQLAKRFPVALIDEFQDTDAIQYRIFNTIYRQPDTSLLMIGDPKQAIYNFRGGDIFAYLEARQAVPKQQRYNLGTNWRSTSGLVKAVNSLFSQTKQPFALREGLDFLPVKHSPSADSAPLIIDGKEAQAMPIWLLEGYRADKKPKNKDEAKAKAAKAVACYVTELLTLAAAGRAKLGTRPLRAEDIAILSLAHSEGALVREELARRGIACVSSTKNRIFDTPEAQYLKQLLKALAEPGNEAQLRLFLATPLMGLSLAEVEASIASEAVWSRLHKSLLDARERWYRQGFMAALLGLVHQLGIPARMLAKDQGERRLTNLLQLAQLLQSASLERPGIEALLNWYAAELASPQESDDYQLRLESDASLVRIVTIHASKGLEYPIVLLPFLWDWQDAGDCLYHQDGRHFWAMGDAATEDRQALANQEQLSERLRLLYVALTRARNQCLLFWGNVKPGKTPQALAWLLHHKPELQSVLIPETLEQVKADLEPLVTAAEGHIQLCDWPLIDGPSYQAPAATATELRAAQVTSPIRNTWRLTSYSGLIRDQAETAHLEQPDHDPDRAEADQGAEAAGYTRFSFPRGPQIGSFLHSLLEHTDFQAIEPEIIDSECKRHGISGQWLPMLEQWLTDILTTELNAEGLRLADISRANRLDELEFYYPVSSLSAAGLKGLLGQYPLYAKEAAALGFGTILGLMRGFIDLIIRDATGRYYILDYKSNHLGNRPQDYGAKQLLAAMDEHQYRLQYLIYCLALHRYLGLRLPGYSYETHFGGVCYLFLRGMQPGSTTGIHFDKPPLALIEALDSLMAAKDAA